MTRPRISATGARKTISHPASPRQHGFTLLEIMVVLALIAISVTFVVINFERDTDSIAELEARRFARLVEQARDESILSGETYAVEVDDERNRYSFLRYSGEWQGVDDELFRPRRIPGDLLVSFELPGGVDGSHRFLVEGLGELPAFQLLIAGDSRVYAVSPDAAQNLVVRDATAK